MKIISFELTMPNRGSWNGQWSGQEKKYYIVKSVSDRWLKKCEYFKQLLEKGRDSWHYNFGDGWSANVYAEIIDSSEAKKRRKASAGFSGYGWMVASIIYNGEIKVAKMKVATVAVGNTSINITEV